MNTRTSAAKQVTHIDADHLQGLIDAHAASLTLYARQWCNAPDDAVQEAFVELLRQDPLPKNPAAWLYTTVRRRAMNLARAESRRAKHHRQAALQRSDHQNSSGKLPPEGDLGETLDVQLLLARLPRTEREIVVARIWGGLSFVEIAELLNQSTSSVHRRYQRALAELGKLMHQQLDHPRTS